MYKKCKYKVERFNYFENTFKNDDEEIKLLDALRLSRISEEDLIDDTDEQIENTCVKKPIKRNIFI